MKISRYKIPVKKETVTNSINLSGRFYQPQPGDRVRISMPYIPTVLYSYTFEAQRMRQVKIERHRKVNAN